MNVNLPAPRRLIWTRIWVRQYEGIIVPTEDPQGRELYWFSVTPPEAAQRVAEQEAKSEAAPAGG